jgi:hypothetical protein
MPLLCRARYSGLSLPLWKATGFALAYANTTHALLRMGFMLPARQCHSSFRAPEGDFTGSPQTDIPVDKPSLTLYNSRNGLFFNNLHTIPCTTLAPLPHVRHCKPDNCMTVQKNDIDRPTASGGGDFFAFCPWVHQVDSYHFKPSPHRICGCYPKGHCREISTQPPFRLRFAPCRKIPGKPLCMNDLKSFKELMPGGVSRLTPPLGARGKRDSCHA